MKKKKIILSGIVVLIIFIGLLLSLFLVKKNKSVDDFDEKLYTQIYFYDLGKSRIEIIKKDNYVILVNTGLEEDRDDLLDHLDQLGIDKINYLVLTNKNDEYIGNASFILNGYPVDYVYLNDFQFTSDKMDELNTTLSDNYANTIILTSDESIKIADLSIEIYPYVESEFSMDDKTLLVKLQEGDNNIYLMHDASNMRFNEIGKSSLLVSENKDMFDYKSEYYIYDGDDSIKEYADLLERNVGVFMDEKNLFVHK